MLRADDETIPNGSGYDLIVPNGLGRIYSNFEFLSSSFVRSNVASGDTFVDVGANFGFYATIASPLVGESGRVLAIEPSIETLNYLHENVGKLPNVDIVPVAVGLENGVSKFFHTSDYVNSGTSAPPFSLGCSRSINVLQICLDTLLSDFYGLETIDFMKIDVQGDDVNVLLGAQDILSASASVKVLVEWAPTWMVNAGFDPLSLPETLESLGFTQLICVDDWTRSSMSVQDFLLEFQGDSSGRRFCNIFARK